MNASLPTVVLVHGAWHTPPNYQSYIDALKAQGFTVHCPHLPSCNGASPPTASLAEDVACVRDVVKPLVEAGERVLMLLHSYGGAVGTDAVEGLTFFDRRAAGQLGGVIHLLYLCAYILQPGSTIFGVVKEAGMDHLWPQFVDNAADGSTFPKDPVQLFFGSVDKDVVDKALPHLVRSPMSAFTAETKGAAWRSVPATYVFTQQDYSVPRVYQDLMVEKVRAEGVVLRTEDYETSHSVFITKQEEMVQAVRKAAEDERNPK
ncbi:MAG: hypothetical protein M1818_006742 [Claussenomyces sp. TS43310]|nr:MAG: hypothetical protein M1818_006742 [Claussenomyces sp. TS43310]